jgi:type VI secretion system protein VasJ
MDSERHEQIVALGKEPITASGPVGDPVRYEEIFESLQGQMDRMSSLTGEEVQWDVVVELATEILKAKSKDLLVMTYLTVGLLEHEGYVGLAAGFEAYREFLKHFWEGCFPKVKPPHGRYNAVQYLADRIQPVVELKAGRAARHPKDDEKEAVHRCTEAVAQLDEAVTAAFASQPETPNLLPMVRAFKALKEKVGPLGAEAPPAAEGVPAAAPAAAPAGVEAVPETFTSATQAVQAVIKVAKFLLSQDNKDARAYRLMRAVHFGGLGTPPKDRIIPAPPAPRRQFFENQAASGNWPQLLTDAEQQFATTPLWLDMQRYVALAANGLGPAYKAVHDAVALETTALQQRMPEVFDLTFKDGTPFADGATRAWLNEVAGQFGGGGGGDRAAAGDALAKAIVEARKLLSAAKGEDAVARLAQAMDGSASRRQRFRAQLALAGFCVDMNRLTLASSLLEGLDGTIEQYRLEDWEPELAARALGDLYACLRKAKPKPTPDEVQHINEVFARLCRLNPAAALKLEAAAKAAK